VKQHPLVQLHSPVLCWQTWYVESESAIGLGRLSGPGSRKPARAPPHSYNRANCLTLSVGSRLGPYEILSPLGAGGMGEVYRARDTKLNRDVAIKVLPTLFAGDAERLARFTREAQTLAALNHPNIAHIHGLEESNGVRALVMELVEGEDLSQRIARGPIPIDEALPIAKQIADALEAAHEQGIIHRDLKPANIKITPDGIVKVLDFGLAKAMDAVGSAPNVTQSPTITSPAMMTGVGVLLGTAAYMSPEQAKGRPADKRADIWAFGVVLFEMLTGRAAFEGETISEVLAKVIEREPDWTALPTGTAPRLRALLRRCVTKDPKTRLQAIGEARITLSQPLIEEGIAVARAQSVLAPLPWAIAGMFLLTTLAISFLHFRESRPPAASIRFQVSTPENTPLGVFQLSPDGRRLAFVTNSAGQSRLWVRSFDSVDAVPLAGSDGANYPFWSPDSTRIGFFAQGKLKTIAAAGGLAVPVCNAANGRGGTWNQNGIILFAPDAVGGLYQVADTGGAAVRVSVVAPSPTDSDRFPEFLPDGRRFVFFRMSSGGDSGIYTGSLSGNAFTRLLPDASNAQYVPGTGHDDFLVFRRGDTLMSQAIDPDRLSMKGGAEPLAEQVSTDGYAGHGAFTSTRDGTLAYSAGIRGGARQLVWLDRSGKRLGVVSKPDEVSSWALSPDESVVAFSVGNFSSGLADLWLQHLTDGTPTKLTFEAARNLYPVWSPDASHIAFTWSREQPSATFEIHQLPLTGAGQSQVLLQGPYNSIAVCGWSRDGKLIAFSSRSAQTKDDLWLLETGGDGKAVLYVNTVGNERECHFSPDGEWLAYQSDESGRNQAYVRHVPLDARKFQISSSSAGGSLPRWSHDGKELFYLEGGQTLMSVPMTPGGDLKPGPGRVLFDHVPFFTIGANASQSAFTPSQDGQRFLALLQAGGDTQASSITVVTNWQSTLRK
jgi:eukaryotic-like serine/threonine-protein kinase